MKRLLLVAFCARLLTSPAYAADAPKHYDDPASFSSDGTTMSATEVMDFLKFDAGKMEIDKIQQAAANLKSLDDLPDFKSKEAEALTDVTNTAIHKMGKIDADPQHLGTHAPNGRYYVGAVRLAIMATYHPMPPPDEKIETEKPQGPDVHVFVRRSSDILNNEFSADNTDVFSVADEKKPSVSNGALLSYSRNLNSARDTLTGEGSVTPAFRFPPDPSTGLQDFWVVPSLDFQHLNGSSVKPVNRIDSLKLGGGVFAVLAHDNFVHLLRADQYSQSDFGFKSFLEGGDLQYELQNDDIYLGHWIRPWQQAGTERDYIIFMPRIALNLDGGHVFDAGDKTTIQTGENYLRFGPRLTLDIMPGDVLASVFTEDILLKCRLQAFYGHYAGILGRACDDYGVNLHLPLDNKGIFGLDATYENGGLNANGDKADQVTVGLSIKQ